MTNKPEQLPEWRKALNEAVENYQSTRAWYEENQDSPSAEQDMDAAEGEIEKLIKQYGVLIVLNLLDEIDELQERRKADSEPVGWTDEEELRDVEKDGCGYLFKANPISPNSDPRRVIKLYRHAQPAPVVPTFDEWLQIRGNKPLGWVKDAMRESYDACRDTMLQAGNSLATGFDPASGPDHSVEVRYFAPPGYVLVPIKPTENMIINGFESEPDEFFSKSEEWDAYQEMSGCEQAAHRAKLCWVAMIKAAPKQENK